MSFNSDNQDEITVEINKNKLFNDELKFILKKTLNGDAGPILNELETVFFARWAAVETGDEEKSDALEVKERELVEKLLAMGAKRD